jgi:hypothetical protein
MDRRLYQAGQLLVDHLRACAEGCDIGSFMAVPARPSSWPTCDVVVVWWDSPTVTNVGAKCCDEVWSVTWHVALSEHCNTHPFKAAVLNADHMTTLAWAHAGKVATILRCLGCDVEPRFWTPTNSGAVAVGGWPFPTVNGPGACGITGVQVQALPTTETAVPPNGVRWVTEWSFTAPWWPACDCDPSPVPDVPPCGIV